MAKNSTVMMRIFVLVAVSSIALGACSAPACADEEWRPARLWITGSDDSIWVVGVSESASPVIQMWHAGKKDGETAPPSQKRFLSASAGGPITLGADAGALRVLFSDLSTRDYFGDRESTVGAWWRGQSDKEPLAWGGDASEAIFWALVNTEALTAPATQPDEEEVGIVEAGDAGEGAESAQGVNGVVETTSGKDFEADGTAEDAADGPLTALQLRGGVWRRLPVLREATEGERFWLSGRGGELYLFWQAPEQGVRAATLSSGTWSKPRQVTAQRDIYAGWSGAWSSGPVFVAGVGAVQDRVQLWLFLWRDGAWSDEGAARDGTELLWIDPAVCGVGVVRGRLGVARPTQDGTVAFGLGDLGVSPSIRFSVLSLEPVEPPHRSAWHEAVLLGLMFGMVFAVFWTRRQQVARQITLPDGMVLTAVHRRVIATLLDYIPAFVVTMLIASPWLMTKMGNEPPDLSWSVLQKQAEDPKLQAIFVPLHYAAVVLYGLWCMIWELSIGTTPGKLLFGCRVRGVDGGPPAARRIILRNLVRVVVFGVGEAGLIVTLMIMLIVSRNRQRIGDLLANTIVVEMGVNVRQNKTGRGDGHPPGSSS